MAWLAAAQHVVEHAMFVIVHDDGAWHVPTEREWLTLEQTDIDPKLPAFDGMILDFTTATMLVYIHDALDTPNQARYEALPLDKAVDVGWHIVKRLAADVQQAAARFADDAQ